MLHQGQGPRAVGDVGEDAAREPGLELQAGRAWPAARSPAAGRARRAGRAAPAGRRRASAARGARPGGRRSRRASRPPRPSRPPGMLAAYIRLPKKAARSPSSWQSVKASSSWSTTTQDALVGRAALERAGDGQVEAALVGGEVGGARGARAGQVRAGCAASAASGCAPGARLSTRHDSPPGSAPRRTAGISPAATSELLPLPEAPSTARKRVAAEPLDQARRRPPRGRRRGRRPPRGRPRGRGRGRPRPAPGPGPGPTSAPRSTRMRSSTPWGSATPARRSIQGLVARKARLGFDRLRAAGQQHEDLAEGAVAPADLLRGGQALAGPVAEALAADQHDAGARGADALGGGARVPASGTSGWRPASSRRAAISRRRGGVALGAQDRHVVAGRERRPAELAGGLEAVLRPLGHRPPHDLVHRRRQARARRPPGVGGAWVRWASSAAASSPVANGGRPASAWKRTQPSA